MPEQLSTALKRLRENRRAGFAELLRYPDQHLDLVCKMSFGTMPARWAALRFADHDEEHTIQIIDTVQQVGGWQRSKAQVILGAAEATRGGLLAALVGLGDDDLDVVPETPEGEWPLRQILSHIIFVEYAYRIDVLHAAENFQAGTSFDELPDIDLPHNYPDASFDDLIAMLDTAREQTLHDLQGIGDTLLYAPTFWDGVAVDANFLMMRLAHHEREHTAHIRKWRVQTGKDQTEIQRLLGLAWISQGRLRECLAGLPEHLLYSKPSRDEWAVSEILDHLVESEHVFRQQLVDAMVVRTAQEQATP